MKESAATPGDQAPVAALLLPLQGLNLVVAQAAVGEVIAAPEAEPVPGSPDWVTGMFAWRGEQLPLISLERLLGRKPAKARSRSRAVVLYGLGGFRGVDYYGIEVDGIPHPVLLRREMVEDLGEEIRQAGMSVGRAVVVGGQPGMIPDLVAIEQALSDWLVRA
ncbi:MAG TPA: chemotaxis protein CheW [Thiotrichales bacterium]|nr:chemotaxis protein CheW [Thiotrichales bacterium]